MPRPHRKSRTGCTQCKRRRVKCDEKKPSCTACDRNSLPCSLEFLTPMSSSNRGNSSINRCQTLSETSHEDLVPFLLGFSRELSGSSLDGQTSELLHHYTTVLSVSLAGDRTPSVWRISMLQMSLGHPFLFSGIMAVSALHLATVLPHRQHELQNFAIAQESAALPSFRETINKPNSESIHAAFAFAGSIVYYIMALPESLDPKRKKVDRCRIPNRVDNYPHWFQAVRGLMALLWNHWGELAQGPFATLLNSDPIPDYSRDNPDDEHLAKLDGMFAYPSVSINIPLLCASPLDSLSSGAYLFSPDASKEEEAREAMSELSKDSSSLGTYRDGRKEELYKEAIEELRKVLLLTRPPNRKLYSEASLRIWPGCLSQEFVELIYERDPRALVILAHYCILLKRNNDVWYLKGLGEGLLKNIEQALEEEWHPWIQWPLDEPCAEESITTSSVGIIPA